MLKKIEIALFSILLINTPLLFSEEGTFPDFSQGEKCGRGQACASYVDEEESLKMCVSFSMPEEAILFLSKELEFYGGSFVLRGIPKSSFPEFFKKINHLREMGAYAPFSIDPDLFEEFSLEGVPTLLLTGEQGTDRVVGNLSIRDSLERISFSGDNKQLAKQKLNAE